MRIAQLANIYRQVNPSSNNAIYSHAGLLTDGLVGNNNNVTLFGAGNSLTKAKLVSVTDLPTADLDMDEEIQTHLMHLLISRCYEKAMDFDIIHSHFTLMSSFYSRLSTTPTVQSLHIPIKDKIKPLLTKFKDNNYISFSLAQRKQMPELNWVANIYHGLDLKEFPFNPHPQDYLLYLSRIAPEKGTHLAIEAALAAGVPLVIAGRSYQKDGYWHNEIEKRIDGKNVRYVGEADFNQKKELLANARALLFPTQVDETFGLSMIEAMACGTPVIGWSNGSVPEVIQDRLTGFEVSDVAGAVKAIKALDKITREASRDRVRRLFSVETMVANYERVYLKVIEAHRAKKK